MKEGFGGKDVNWEGIGVGGRSCSGGERGSGSGVRKGVIAVRASPNAIRKGACIDGVPLSSPEDTIIALCQSRKGRSKSYVVH